MARAADSIGLVVGLEKAETRQGTVYWSHIAASNCPWLQAGPTPHGSLEEAIEFLVEQFRECLEHLARLLDAPESEEGGGEGGGLDGEGVQGGEGQARP